MVDIVAVFSVSNLIFYQIHVQLCTNALSTRISTFLQLRQEVEGWAERVSELEAEMRRYEVAHSGMLQDVTNKDERIMV